MRTPALAASLALLAGTAAASGGSITWYSNAGTINSRGLRGDANNAVLTLPLPSTGGVGAAWNYLTVSGNLNKVNSATFAAEACIEITTPAGDKMVIKPFETGSFSGTIAIPAGAAVAPPYTLFSSGGNCTLRFFELYADSASGPDSTWSNLTITLHDDHDTFPFDQTPPVSAAEPDFAYDSDWFTHGSVTSDTLVFSHDRVVSAYRMLGYGTALCGWSSSLTASPLSLARYTITADRADGAGTVSWTVTPFGQYAASTSRFDLTGNTPAPVLIGSTHPWHCELTESIPGPTAAGTRLASIWYSVQPLTGAAPAATDLGTVRGVPSMGPAETAVVKTRTFTAQPGEVKWFTFTTEHACSTGSGYWLDIHSEIPAGSPIVDHEMGMYDPAGNRLANDDDGGTSGQSMLTFGQTSPVRPAVNPLGGPKPRNGSDGALPLGVHYLAVGQYNMNFANTGWYVTSAGANTGDIRFDIRTNLPPLPCGPADVGGQGGVLGADGTLDNNDFIVFVDRFFSHAPSADIGIQGGIPGADGQWDNNDFIVFINQFFAGCP